MLGLSHWSSQPLEKGAKPLEGGAQGPHLGIKTAREGCKTVREGCTTDRDGCSGPSSGHQNRSRGVLNRSRGVLKDLLWASKPFKRSAKPLERGAQGPPLDINAVGEGRLEPPKTFEKDAQNPKERSRGCSESQKTLEIGARNLHCVGSSASGSAGLREAKACRARGARNS